LLGDFKKRGINNLARFGKDALIVKRLIEPTEQRIDNFFLDQCLTEFPD